MADIPRWWMKGDWFDVCRCNIPCPCEFAQPPTDNHCEGVLAYQIREGAYGELRLDGLRVVIIGMFDGNLWAGGGPLTNAVFIDEGANLLQRDALQKVFSGQAGGFMAIIGKLIGEVRAVEYVP